MAKPPKKIYMIRIRVFNYYFFLNYSQVSTNSGNFPICDTESQYIDYRQSITFNTENLFYEVKQYLKQLITLFDINTACFLIIFYVS